MIFRIAVTFAVCCATLLFRLVKKWVNTRRYYSTLPGPPHSFWFGHLRVFGGILAELPAQTHPHIATAICAERYGLGSIFYLDLWPFAQSFLVVTDPGVATQVTQVHNLPKHPMEANFLRHMVGERSLVSANGEEWRTLRAALNPGFSASHIINTVPRIMRHMLVFRDRLGVAADNQEIIRLQDIAAFATATLALGFGYEADITVAADYQAIDVIGQAALGIDLNSQQAHNDIAYDFRRVIALSRPVMDLLGTFVTFIPQWWYGRHLDKAIRRAILSQYQKPDVVDWEYRAVPDLILQAARGGKLASIHYGGEGYKNNDLMQLAVNNVKGLLLGGHDTSASTFSYIVYLLSQNPHSLAALRREHDSLLGTDIQSAARISSEPYVLNQLPYTTACIREALRLFPPAATVRASNDAFKSITYHDQELPLSNIAIWITQFAMGRDPEIWDDALAFKPERFMPGYTPEVPREAFRPFEKGPRACIGIELAYIELRIMLVLVARAFDFEPAYETSSPRTEERWGGVAFQIMELAPKPAGHMPMRVKKRSLAETNDMKAEY